MGVKIIKKPYRSKRKKGGHRIKGKEFIGKRGWDPHTDNTPKDCRGPLHLWVTKKDDSQLNLKRKQHSDYEQKKAASTVRV